MVRAFLLCAVVLSGCGPSKDSVDVADVNARNALARVSALSARIDELESRVEELQTDLQNEASTRESEDAQIASDFEDHTHY